MVNDKENIHSHTELDEFRDLSPEQGERKARFQVMSAFRALMGKRAIERDARENAHDKQREEKKK